MWGATPLRRLSAVLIVPLVGLAACQDDLQPVLPSSPDAPLASAQPATGQGRITTDPAEFASALQRIGNDNQVIVHIKDAWQPPLSVAALRQMPSADVNVVAVPASSGETRGVGVIPPARSEALRAVLTQLHSAAITPERVGEEMSFITFRIPDDRLVPVVTLLLSLPNVDFIEANQRRPVDLLAAPVGSNPIDLKHSMHHIDRAWNYTRGQGARVGVLDTGYAFDLGTQQWHPDGNYTGTEGIIKVGFSDDYLRAGYNCGAGQTLGGCVAYDDNGHGTAMAGLVGENDNSLGNVGVMPFGRTYSMKMVTNDFVSQAGCGGTRTDCIEDDDFAAALNYAAANNLDVLSMSFGLNSLSFQIQFNLSSLYSNYNVVLLAATGNGTNQDLYPSKLSFVIGVGGLDANGNSIFNDRNEEVSAFSNGTSTMASCPSIFSFCSPGGYGTVGGTSTSTATAAGIAGLVAAYNPTLTSAQIRNRLVSTSSGPSHTLDAYRAVTGIPPMAVSISGPPTAEPFTSQTWTASASNGTAPYTFAWYRDGTFVGSGASFSTNVGSSSFTLKVIATDSFGDTVATSRFISVTSSTCEPSLGQLICAQ